jgi:hypothetical protein
MADPKGFLTAPRQDCARRPVRERVRDWNEVYDRQCLLPVIGTQAGRCMDCGIPFCHHGCPLGNLIPEWNDFVWRGDWAAASERLHATNNFPEFTGRLCPAPCEPACVLAIDRPRRDDQERRGHHRRPGMGAWIRHTPAGEADVGKDRRRDRLRTGGSRVRAAAHTGRAHGHGV